ncbi:OmpA family protein [Paracoccus suum]|uniref:OmpA family protein n=1 Tax=Paracoccus suum TaxID=2259340 RepID=A0A344PIE0_9RHOB|nr:OmpA family protein [Paracoccus suum]AXC49145.1 OmpA family protein [Paracoccus suum]
MPQTATTPLSRPAAPARNRPVVGVALRALVLAAAGTGCWFGATEAADFIERRSSEEVRLALASGGFDWATLRTDGLQVALGGIAPDEGARFRAIAQAGAAVGPGRVVDRIEIAQRDPAAAPDFRIELLRNDAGLSMIGLIPASADRLGLARLLADGAGHPAVTDLLEAADYPAPPGWEAALSFGMTAIQSTPRAKVSITPGHVAVTALADNPRDKVRLEASLARAAPAGVTLDARITAPRPVIAPFTLRFVKDAAGARFDACAADTETARQRILTAAEEAGAAGEPVCTIGLGAPGAQWADAAVAAIEAVAAIGAGSATLSDTDIALDAPETVPQDRFDAAVERLGKALPAAFDLEATLARPAQPEAAPQPAEFTATRAGDGRVTLRGRVSDDRMRNAIESVARARFPNVESALRTDPSVPAGWSLRVIAAIEAMAGLDSGSTTVTPELIRIDGVSGSETASNAAAAALGRRLGAGADFALSIRYDRRLDQTLSLPTGQECVDRANRVLATSEIGFEPSKAEFAGDVAPTIAALKEALNECGAFRIGVGGHTDSQGSDDFNMTLSQNRAQSVLTALTEGGIDTHLMNAAGFGETQPIGPNDTEAGREANRRIEFRLLAPDPVEAGGAPPVAVVTGVTAVTIPEAPANSGAPTDPVSLAMPELGSVPPALAAPPHLPTEASSLALRVISGAVDPATSLALQVVEGSWTGEPLEAAASLAAEVAGMITDDEFSHDEDAGMETPEVPNPELGMAGPPPEGYTDPASDAGAAQDEAGDVPAQD